MSRLVSFIILGIMLTAIQSTSFAQRGTDKKAEKILDHLKNKYEAYQSMELDFELYIEIPDEEAFNQLGKLIQQGAQYMVDLPDQAIYSNGQALWVHLKNNEEVQINDIEEDGATDILSPKDLLNMYQSDQFEYAYRGKAKEKGAYFEQIEFKPTDEFSDYAKIRLYIDKARNELDKVIVFSKDASRYTMTIKNIQTNLDYKDDVFTFDTSKHPNIHIEDLRID